MTEKEHAQLAALKRVLNSRNAFEALNLLPKAATSAEAKDAFKKLSFLIHPDKCVDLQATEAMQHLNMLMKDAAEHALAGMAVLAHEETTGDSDSDAGAGRVAAAEDGRELAIKSSAHDQRRCSSVERWSIFRSWQSWCSEVAPGAVHQPYEERPSWLALSGAVPDLVAHSKEEEAWVRARTRDTREASQRREAEAVEKEEVEKENQHAKTSLDDAARPLGATVHQRPSLLSALDMSRRTTKATAQGNEKAVDQRLRWVDEGAPPVHKAARVDSMIHQYCWPAGPPLPAQTPTMGVPAMRTPATHCSVGSKVLMKSRGGGVEFPAHGVDGGWDVGGSGCGEVVAQGWVSDAGGLLGPRGDRLNALRRSHPQVRVQHLCHGERYELVLRGEYAQVAALADTLYQQVGVRVVVPPPAARAAAAHRPSLAGVFVAAARGAPSLVAAMEAKVPMPSAAASAVSHDGDGANASSFNGSCLARCLQAAEEEELRARLQSGSQ
eukprot:CAMPEP_0115854798 /NCGR_PEP_ID=MMETSP0287-20121206/14212_1 /TAXON_ID=412157 /ORGANISM="Chrysochromulina rotalis, Strain UIO044" /LENGTH=495 /DNA_ID=CAMNT_0003308931 /DNA_START=85 /DNA_END=1568 /DNA_ORIENTATION=-